MIDQEDVEPVSKRQPQADTWPLGTKGTLSATNSLWMAVLCLGTLVKYAAAPTIHLSIRLSIHYFTHLSVFPPSLQSSFIS